MFFDLKLILGQLVVFFFNILEDVSSFNTTKLKKKKNLISRLTQLDCKGIVAEVI